MMSKQNVRILVDEWLSDFGINDCFEGSIENDTLSLSRISPSKNKHKNQSKLRGFGEDILL